MNRKGLVFVAMIVLAMSSAFAGKTFDFDIGLGINAEYDMMSMRESADFGKSLAPVLHLSLENVSGDFLPIRLDFRCGFSKIAFWEKETNVILMGTADLKLFTLDPFAFFVGGGIITDVFKQSESGPSKVYGCVSAAVDIEFSESMVLDVYTVIPAKQISGAIDQKRDKSVDTDGIPHAVCGAALVIGLM